MFQYKPNPEARRRSHSRSPEIALPTQSISPLPVGPRKMLENIAARTALVRGQSYKDTIIGLTDQGVGWKVGHGEAVEI